jgi:integrase
MSTQVEGRLKRRFESRATGAEWVFPGRHGRGHLKEIRGALKEMGQDIGSPFMIHDLRRTFATMADEAGVPYEAIKRALNHKSGDVTAKYIIGRADSMRETFQKVADMVDWWALKEPPGGLDDDAPDGETDNDEMYA